tara:strand:+ start:931 stop:1530 length:600 start_codon:yes stop_codon:yes gene_type:complete
MPVKIHGKEYKLVAERVQEFLALGKEECLNQSIETEIVMFEGNDCIIKATIKVAGEVVATGIAHEVRGSTNINQTSHVENCETSAIGRALAAYGLAGTEYASADEVVNAINQQSELKYNKMIEEKLCAQRDIFLTLGDDVLLMKALWTEENYKEAYEIWCNFSEENKEKLWVAPSKGGLFTTEERAFMKTSEFRGESNE